MTSRPVVIVLAAGKGSRFVGVDHKLAQSLGTTTVLGSTLAHAIASHLPVVVVTTQRHADLARPGQPSCCITALRSTCNQHGGWHGAR